MWIALGLVLVVVLALILGYVFLGTGEDLSYSSLEYTPKYQDRTQHALRVKMERDKALKDKESFQPVYQEPFSNDFAPPIISRSVSVDGMTSPFIGALPTR